LQFILIEKLMLIKIIWYKQYDDFSLGPPRLPIFGNLLAIGNRMPLAFLEYAKIYGPIFSVKMGGEELVQFNTKYKHCFKIILNQVFNFMNREHQGPS